ncbi:MAG: DUF1003 domain-containing protein [Anaerolineae bacterium]|nr:DUF1003 domain-containing protein [Anaerolineae bacterium]
MRHIRSGRRQEIVTSLRTRANAKRTWTAKLADWLTARFGTMTFLVINITWFAVWITLNSGALPGVEPFDPYPFSFLTFVVSLEAIVLAIIVLISQNREERIATLRQEVDLQINMQTEKELTKLMELVVMLLELQGVDVDEDEELHAMLTPTRAEKIEEALEKEIDEHG